MPENKKIVGEIEGGIVELENHEKLLELLYYYGSDKIASALNTAIEKVGGERKSEPETDESLDPSQISDFDLLKLVKTAFVDLKETPMIIIEKE